MEKQIKEEISEEEKAVCAQCIFSNSDIEWCENPQPYCKFVMWQMLDKCWADFPKEGQVVLVLIKEKDSDGFFCYREAQYRNNKKNPADSWRTWGNCPGDIVAWMEIPKCYKTHVMQDMEFKEPIDKPGDVVPRYIRHELHCPICGDIMAPIHDYNGGLGIPQDAPVFSDPKQHPHICTKCRYVKLYGISHDYPYIETVYEPVRNIDTIITTEAPIHLPVDYKE